MPAPTDVPRNATTDAVNDEALYCPICNYNLTGISSNRCPECGSLFHRESLLAAQKLEYMTLIPWDDPSPRPLPARFFRTLFICLFGVRRFAHAFSVQPQRTRAAGFFVLVLVLTTSIVMGITAMILILGENQPGGSATAQAWPYCHLLFACLFSLFLVGISVPCCTYLSAAVLFVCCPYYDRRRYFRPWLSISAYAAAHHLMMTMGIVVLTIAVILLGPIDGPGIAGLTCALGWIACGLLEAFTLCGVAENRSARTTGSRLAPLILLPLNFALHVAGAIGSGFLASACFDLMNLPTP